MNSEPERLSKRPNDSYKAVIAGVTLCAKHFRTEMDEADIAIFLHALRDVEFWRIAKAFERCLNECEFMPKLADVWAKTPEPEPAAHGDIEGLGNQEWTEGYEGRTLHYRGDPKGTRVVTRIEPRL